MKSMLKFELRRLFKMKLLYICLGVIAALALMNVLSTWLVNKILNFEAEGMEFIAIPAATALSILKSEMAQQSGLVMIALFVTLYLCDDDRNNTLKNIYARGFGRDVVYYSKLIVALGVSAVLVIVDWLFAFVFGCMFFKVGNAGGAIAGTLGVQLIAVLAFAALFVFLTTVIKKTGGAIVCNIIVTMFSTIVFNLIDLVINWVSHSDVFKISDYWLGGIISNVAADAVAAKTFIVSTVLSVVYLAAFIVGGMFVNRKREV